MTLAIDLPPITVAAWRIGRPLDDCTPDFPYGFYCPVCNHTYGDIGPIARDNRERTHQQTHNRELLIP